MDDSTKEVLIALITTVSTIAGRLDQGRVDNGNGSHGPTPPPPSPTDG